jgi:hypothetical protein
MDHSANEIDRFKSEINLIEYASHKGYQVDRAESSRNSVVMRYPATDDKIIVARGPNGHWKYFSVRDSSDNGTIIDFAQKRDGKNLGDIRKELRPWIGENPKMVALKNFDPNIEPTVFDREKVQKSFNDARPLTNARYLIDRGISRETLNDPRFQGMIFQDQRNNIIFPHRDREGLSGFELKNRNFTGFSRYGQKAVWHSRVRATDKKLVFGESAIDLLSYHQIKGDENTRYMSTAGQMSPYQEDIMKAAINKMPPDAEIIAAFDNDIEGAKFTEKLKKISPNLKIIVDAPTVGKDWNDQLKDMLKIKNKAMRIGTGNVLCFSR